MRIGNSLVLRNHWFTAAIILALSLGRSGGAQVLAASKIKDPVGQQLQQTYIDELRRLGADAGALRFPYPFYFSETLDIDESKQKQSPQGSLHFDRYNGQIVLEITGNYYISYSEAMLNSNQRSRKTYEDVVLPLLKIAVNKIDRKVPIDAYAFEIAHHVRRKVLKVDTEGPENLTLIIPRAIGERLAAAKDRETAQAALLESAVYLNGEPLSLWLSGDDAPADIKDHYVARHTPHPEKQQAATDEPVEPGTLVSPHLIPESELLNRIRESKSKPHDVSPQRLASLQTANEATLQRMLSELKAEARFVDYAPPSFIAFHDGAYLQLNLTTELASPAGSSQYGIAALAFDNHIAHLLRPVSKYFQDNPQFNGIDFSTTIHQSAEVGSESVEFVVPLSVLSCYVKYDCTGQELINRSIILINGERVSLDLERAESGAVTAAR
jgi:hypothetical protein